MEKRQKKRLSKKNKRAVSLMVSYVLLISIVVMISIGVYAWLNGLGRFSPEIDCEEGTSLVIDEITGCNSGGPLEFNVRNNGRFNINGVLVGVSDAVDKYPVVYLNPEGTPDEPGFYSFPPASPLKPSEPDNIKTIKFTNIDSDGNSIGNIYSISIQPFILDKRNRMVLCENAVIIQPVQGCNLA